MDDLISRQAAIDSFWKLDIEMRPSAIDAITGILEQLPSAQQWIPCSDRLPEEYAQYLVCYEDGECFVYWLEDADWARGVIEKEHIVAWMPLPEPYKEGTNYECID